MSDSVTPQRLKSFSETDFETLKLDLEHQRSYNKKWGRNHNVLFHIIFTMGAAAGVLAVGFDLLGWKGSSIFGLAGGAFVATPSAFKMKEKSLWYFEYASQLDAILYRLGVGALDHARAVEEFIRLDTAMTKVWAGLTRSIDIKPVVEAAKREPPKNND